jgi:hypothetical protein
MTTTTYPQAWQELGHDFDPNKAMMKLKTKDYLTVPNRLLWFIRDQRAMIMAGLAKCPYVIETVEIEIDRQAGYARYKTFIRDVLGNEATAYGTETAKDFADYPEKAGTKSVGRALIDLGYGTNMAPEEDEGDNPVDAPRERKQQTTQTAPTQKPPAKSPVEEATQTSPSHLSLVKELLTKLDISLEFINQGLKKANELGNYAKAFSWLKTPATASKMWASAHTISDEHLTKWMKACDIDFPTLYEELLADQKSIWDRVTSPFPTSDVDPSTL